MKNFSLMVLLILGCSQAGAQSVQPETINSSGRHSTTGGIHFEYAVGGLAPSSLDAGPVLLTQDFLQPFAGTATEVPAVGSPQLTSGTVVNNAGTTLINGNNLLEYTLGEFASITLSNSNNLLTQGILQPYLQQGPLPVTGLDFTARRINTNQVLLNWSTKQEINNSGFYIERKKETETDFAPLTFISSKATDGNSVSALSYTYTDMNGYSGKTYYRLKQLDKDEKYVFSPIRIVAAQEKDVVMMKAWPVPAINNLNVKVTGIKSTEQLQVLDMQGRVVKRYLISNEQIININGLPSGTYILRLIKEIPVTEKIVIQ
ncbi:T9SS type A sorting domain-containing protein [Pseudobacter ginsenosidimutans]|uniref:Putative secreted protein (Por secretion system target) n=1 Tax=Pseudobacter ginsenosidimutans TaxID=661488 RepID=A0A4Q7N6A5_9BACT|nr:T9SS type A sorting domain-containing protein [Pseudobacter ginsenosidimutans]QEC45119.1 T9SS type A sorting domain-containing protein [Pseudobacter ginsenosidimutans]RZS76615.1 putative secreted protein (Por secretion system target) [Pseudobacter ginsenosidimutans]